MPSGNSSGSHGGGGSHFSGGNSHHNEHSMHTSMHTSPMHSPRPHFRGFWGYSRPRVVVVHNRRFLAEPTVKGSIMSFVFTFIAVLGVFALIISSAFFAMNNNTANYIAQDYVYYHNMIFEAKSNPKLVKMATITSHGYNAESNKYYYNYEIDLSMGFGTLSGYTYAVYTAEQIHNYTVGSKIQVAVSTEDVTILTDSIPMDFENVSVAQDGEYIQATNAKNVCQGFMIGGGVVIVLGIIAIIFVNIKVRKLTPADQPAEQTPQQTQSTPSTGQDANYNSEVTYCPYCGERITKGTKKCPKCKAYL